MSEVTLLWQDGGTTTVACRTMSKAERIAESRGCRSYRFGSQRAIRIAGEWVAL